MKDIMLWGFRVGHWRTAQGTYIINADNTERPAMTWLRGYVQSTTSTGTFSQRLAVG